MVPETMAGPKKKVIFQPLIFVNSLLVSLDLPVRCLEMVPVIFSQMVVKYGDEYHGTIRKKSPKKKHPRQEYNPQKDDSNVHFPHPATLVYQKLSKMTWKKNN